MGREWIDLLDEEDIAFLKRFLLASGSLKSVAEGYGISYPTVRQRLDRLIDKVHLVDKLKKPSEFEFAVRQLHIDGAISATTVKRLLELHRQELEKADAPAGTIPLRDRSSRG